MEPRAKLVQVDGVTLLEMQGPGMDEPRRMTLEEANQWTIDNIEPSCERGDCFWCVVMDALEGIR